MADIDITSYPAMLSPLKLSGKRLRNRVIHASMTTELAENSGVTDGLIQYHVNRAIWSEAFEEGSLEYENVYTGERGIIPGVVFLACATPANRMTTSLAPCRSVE